MDREEIIEWADELVEAHEDIYTAILFPSQSIKHAILTITQQIQIIAPYYGDDMLNNGYTIPMIEEAESLALVLEELQFRLDEIQS